MLNEITPGTFLGDRNQKIREAISVGYDKDYITKCVYEQQSGRDVENRLNRAQCKQLVYSIAYEVYMNNLRGIGWVRE